jgi:hypothetical protein
MLSIRLIWNRQVVPLNGLGLREVYVDPEPDYPVGQKGHVLASFWECLSDWPRHNGMLIVDGDVVIDPIDLAAMNTSIMSAPEDVHAAPTRLWPISTKLSTWIWGHGHDVYGGASDEPVTRFTFCCTYLPGELIEACIDQGMHDWLYPNVDKKVSQVAAELGFEVHLVEGATPKHLNF